MTTTPFHAQREAYNKAALCATEAHTLLGTVRAVGWEQHVLLNQVFEKLFETCEALLDIEPNLLGYETRETLRGMRRES